VPLNSESMTKNIYTGEIWWSSYKPQFSETSYIDAKADDAEKVWDHDIVLGDKLK